jgi:hypothetical protein
MNDTPQSDKPKFQDITLYDQESGEPFIFTAKEQEFFAKQGFANVPKHSPERRKLLREQRYSGKPIFNVTCMQCKRVGKVTQEPPDLKRVLCENCFNEQWGNYLEKHPELKQQFPDSAL